MEIGQFERVKERFRIADVNGKIDIYITTEGLSQDQYKQLLRMFPLEHLAKLEAAL